VYFGLNTDQKDLQSSVRRFLDRESPIGAARELLETEKGYDDTLWLRMAEALGLQGLAVPEAYGGSGASFVELVITLEEMGRQLVSSPFFSSAVLATRTLLHSADGAALDRYLPDIASGASIATLAVTEDSGSWDLRAVGVTAVQRGDGYELTGHKSFVPDGHLADVVLVVARSQDGLCLFAVDGGAAGMSRTPMPVLDGTRRLARLEFDATPAVLIGSAGAAGPPLRHALDEAAVALSAEQLGGAQRCLDMAVEYAGSRVAFGRPIGSFQAVKHKCADMFLGVESARSAVYHAAWSVAAGSEEVSLLAAVTKAHTSEVYLKAASQNIQIHGGIGFTWEHDAHLHLKRARSSLEFLGSPDHHLDEVASLIGL
jgi:alkylation response protein AidB-like acyl-CoA dehydrogenase